MVVKEKLNVYLVYDTIQNCYTKPIFDTITIFNCFLKNNFPQILFKNMVELPTPACTYSVHASRSPIPEPGSEVVRAGEKTRLSR